MMQRSGYFAVIGIIAVLTILGLAISGCCGGKYTSRQPSLVDQHWGTSFESAKCGQILNPEAGKNSVPVVGLNGTAAENTIQRYRKSFKKEIPAPVYNISIGNLSNK